MTKAPGGWMNIHICIWICIYIYMDVEVYFGWEWGVCMYVCVRYIQQMERYRLTKPLYSAPLHGTSYLIYASLKQKCTSSGRVTYNNVNILVLSKSVSRKKNYPWKVHCADMTHKINSNKNSEKKLLFLSSQTSSRMFARSQEAIFSTIIQNSA